MPDIPERYVDRYVELVRGASETAAEVATMQLDAMPKADPAQLKANIRTLLRASDREASEIDRSFYEASRAHVTGEERSFGTATGGLDEEEVDRALDAMLREYGEYAEDGAYELAEPDRLRTDLSQFVMRMVNDLTKGYMEAYGERDPKRPRFARVPRGTETCAYCWALAGLGFQYRSAETARRHGHASCDCAIVPSWAGSGVAGYDPQRYADLFNGARDWLRSEDAPEELVRRVRRDRSKPGYTESFNGVLAAMRARYGLK